jgi:hypothetical protein
MKKLYKMKNLIRTLLATGISLAIYSGCTNSETIKTSSSHEVRTIRSNDLIGKIKKDQNYYNLVRVIVSYSEYARDEKYTGNLFLAKHYAECGKELMGQLIENYYCGDLAKFDIQKEQDSRLRIADSIFQSLTR